MAGGLIGMNTAIISQSGGNVGIGFAIPVDMVKAITQQLIASGKVSRGELGVIVQDLTPVLAQAMGLNVSSGALVTRVLPDSPAARGQGIDPNGDARATESGGGAGNLPSRSRKVRSSRVWQLNPFLNTIQTMEG